MDRWVHTQRIAGSPPSSHNSSVKRVQSRVALATFFIMRQSYQNKINGLLEPRITAISRPIVDAVRDLSGLESVGSSDMNLTLFGYTSIL